MANRAGASGAGAGSNLLLVAGLDPSGGAGLLADARVAERHGMRPVGVVTALTVQTTSDVRAVESVAAELVGAQLTALLSDAVVAAGAIGMLGDESVAEAVAEALRLTAAPIVWDPVLRASAGGAALYRGDPRRALALLRDHVALITPNLAEAEALAGFEVRDRAAMRRAARAIAAGGAACLVKGGHLAGGGIVGEAAPGVIDVLAAGDDLIELEGARVPGGEDVHGTGGALATAIACHLAAGADLASAARAAAAFVRQRLAAPIRSGRGKPSVL
jgi:hydroxymethylpyrimidine kinase/phosphomethylpyrimidine kinase